NSIAASSELKTLYQEYQKFPSMCHLELFSKNVTCKAQGIIGTGAGAEFQRFVKACPAFAVEYAMITLRVLRKHYGPINRKEAELNLSCNSMLKDVQEYVESKGNALCSQL